MTEPVETFRATVFPWHCDQFGHMNARWYAAFFDDASFHLYQRAGLSYPRMHETGPIVPVVAEITITYVHELVAGDLFVIRSGFTRIGNKSIQRIARMYNADTDTLCAIERGRDVFFDETTRLSTPMPESFRAQFEACLLADEGA